MNPSIEVQITARLDQLDAGLKMAEAKIAQSAKTMGGLGDSAGGAYIQNMVSKIAKGLAVGAVTNVLGGGLLNLVKGLNAGKSGVDIGEDISKGIVDGAKGIPIAGTFISIFDEIVNGADRAAEVMTAKISQTIEKRIEATKKYMDGLTAFKSKTEQMFGVNVAGGDPLKLLEQSDAEKTRADKAEENRLIELEQERSVQRRAEIDAKYKAKGIDSATHSTLRSLEKSKNEDIEKLRRQHQEKLREIEVAGIARETQRDREFWAERTKLVAEATAKQSDITTKALQDQERMNQEAEKNYDRFVQGNIDDAKRMTDAKIQAQQDIIDAERASQGQVDKVGRVNQLAQQAAQGLIHSGQTALGQFSFAQGGAGGQAMNLAQKQVASLEKIEAATAEQVRLTKENQGFR